MVTLHSNTAELFPPCAHQSYVIGQDPEGHWLAVETHGLGGGIFRSRADAVQFAEFESDHDPSAVRYTSEPLGFTYAKAPFADAGGLARSQGR